MRNLPFKSILFRHLFSRFAVLSTLFAIIMAGCGGGGGGPSSPDDDTAPDVNATPLPGPTPTALPVGNCNNSTYTPNYADEIDLLLRWSGFPLRVFFVRDSEYSQQRQNLTLAGLDQWVEATNGRITYSLVNSAGDANVVVNFGDYTGGGTLGLTSITYRSNIIQRVEIEILFTGNNTTDRVTAAHEWGHALGITDHTENNADIMNPFGNSLGCGCITTRDRNTLLTAYCNDFTTRNLPRNLDALGPERTIVIEDQYPANN